MGFNSGFKGLSMQTGNVFILKAVLVYITSTR